MLHLLSQNCHGGERFLMGIPVGSNRIQVGAVLLNLLSLLTHPIQKV